MTDHQPSATLAFHVEAADPSQYQSLEGAAGTMAQQLGELPGVGEARAEVTGSERFIDPLSLAAILVSIKVVVQESGNIVEGFDQLVTKLKHLGRDLGLGRIWMEWHRKKLYLDELTPEQQQEVAGWLAAQAAQAAPPPAPAGG